MENIKNTLKSLLDVMTVSGFEHRERKKLTSILSEYGEVSVDKLGNYTVTKRAAKKDAPTLLIDAHIDEIGMAVTKIHEGGFLSVTQIGGLDTHVMQSAEVEIYGNEVIYGVVGSTPPHLRARGEGKMKKIEELLIDTGIERTRLEELVPIGSPVRFKEDLYELDCGIVCGHSLDNKVCCACALEAIKGLSPEEMSFDAVVLLSLREESGAYAGARVGVQNIKPDLAISLDVNFAAAPETSFAESAQRGEGYTISLSAVTSRALTKRIIGVSKYSRLPYRVIAEPNNVGMNANVIGLMGEGIPCADLGIPLGSMHTSAETVSLFDCDALRRLLQAVIKDETLAAEYRK